MCKSLHLIIWAMILSGMLAACQRIPSRERTCAELLAIPLQAYIGQSVAVATFAEAVAKEYDVSRQEIHINIHDDGGWLLSWTQNGLRYGASSKNGTNLDRIGIDYDSVTIQQLLNCIPSPPEWYWAAYGPHPPTTGIRYAVVLYFPAQGVVATATGYDQNKDLPPSMSASLPLSNVFVGASGSISASYKQRWDRSLEETQPSLHPILWPGDWKAVHFVENREPGW